MRTIPLGCWVMEAGLHKHLAQGIGEQCHPGTGRRGCQVGSRFRDWHCCGLPLAFSWWSFSQPPCQCWMPEKYQATVMFNISLLVDLGSTTQNVLCLWRGGSSMVSTAVLWHIGQCKDLMKDRVDFFKLLIANTHKYNLIIKTKCLCFLRIRIHLEVPPWT